VCYSLKLWIPVVSGSYSFRLWIPVVSVLLSQAVDTRIQCLTFSGCGYPRRIRFRAGQEMKLKWTPGDKVNAVGVSFCSDTGQSECFVLDMFGESNRQLHFWWRKHGSKEKGANGWVPGKDGRFPETVIKGGPKVSSLLKIAFSTHFTQKSEARHHISYL